MRSHQTSCAQPRVLPRARFAASPAAWGGGMPAKHSAGSQPEQMTTTTKASATPAQAGQKEAEQQIPMMVRQMIALLTEWLCGDRGSLPTGRQWVGKQACGWQRARRTSVVVLNAAAASCTASSKSFVMCMRFSFATSTTRSSSSCQKPNQTA